MTTVNLSDLARLRAAGASWHAIADELGLPVMVAWRLGRDLPPALRAAVPRRPPPKGRPAVTTAAVVALRRSGKRSRQIGRSRLKNPPRMPRPAAERPQTFLVRELIAWETARAQWTRWDNEQDEKRRIADEQRARVREVANILRPLIGADLMMRKIAASLVRLLAEATADDGGLEALADALELSRDDVADAMRWS
jgi:hypothetical protein